MGKIIREECKKFTEYYQKYFPTLSKEECDKLAFEYRKTCNKFCIEYYHRYFPKLSDKEKEEKRQECIKLSNQKNKNRLEYYIINYPDLTLEEQEIIWHEYSRSRNSQTIEYFKRKYPDLTLEEQEQLLHDSIVNRNNKRKSIKGENNPNHKSKTTLIKRQSTSPNSIEFYKRKYPNLSLEEQTKLLLKHQEKNRVAVKNAIKSTNIEFYLNKGMSEDEAKLALQERQRTFTLEKCIKKYGEEEGTKRFKERQQKWIHKVLNTVNSNGNIAQSSFALKCINEIIKQIDNKYKIIPEKLLSGTVDNNLYTFSYDLMIENILIEFQGDYFHCNPKLYDGDFYNKLTKQYARDIWNKDENKKKLALSHGYKIYYIWEYDYMNDCDNTLKKCIKFINENIN